MLFRGILTALLICLLGYSIWAQQYIFSTNCVSAYNNIVSTNTDNARLFLKQEQQADPKNLIPILLTDYIEFVELYLNTGTQNYSEFTTAQENRLNQIKSGPNNSPFYLYIQARINLHNTLIALQQHEYIKSFWSARKAYKDLEECLYHYPNFKPAQKDMAILQIVLGVIPSKFQWGLNMLGMQGNLALGNKTLLQLCDSSWLMRDETIMTTAMLFSHVEGLHSKAWNLLERNGYPMSGNLFSYYITADVALYSKHNEVVIAILKNPKALGADNKMPYLYYLSGLAHLQKLDTVSKKAFTTFLSQHNNPYHVKSAYQKIAWHYLLQGDTANYRYYIAEVLTHGEASLEIDIQAQEEATNGIIPDINLLNGRLLFDGGYYKKSIAAIQQYNIANSKNENRTVEYHYRLARAYDEMGNDSLALVLYDKTIALGSSLPIYYAGNAALKAAYIYEEQGNNQQAKKYYNRCLAIKGHEYEQSLHQKARAGLERLN